MDRKDLIVLGSQFLPYCIPEPPAAAGDPDERKFSLREKVGNQLLAAHHSASPSIAILKGTL